MSGQINIKMKMADPEEISALMTDAVKELTWFAGCEGYAERVVRNIHLALTNAGCVMIQVDPEVAAQTPNL